jgi:hypothetical protein
MSVRIPNFLTNIDLPYPELQAATRDGDLVALDEGFTPLDVPLTSVIRAQSLLELVCRTPLVAELESAAWIYGALPQPPHIHRLCVNIDARLRLVPISRRRVREVVFHEGDVTTIGNLSITSLMRTIIDLLREPTVFTKELTTTTTSLMSMGGIAIDDVAHRLHGWARAPHKRRACNRLMGLRDAIV